MALNVRKKWNPSLRNIQNYVLQVVWRDKFIIFGGKLGGKAVQMFSISSSIWSSLEPMISARNFFSCTLLPSRTTILVLSTVPGINETTAELLNPATNTWASTGSTLYPRAGASLVVLGHRVFAIGGNFNPLPANLSATAEEYDLKSGNWSLAKAGLITGRRIFGAVSVPAAIFDTLPNKCVGV